MGYKAPSHNETVTINSENLKVPSESVAAEPLQVDIFRCCSTPARLLSPDMFRPTFAPLLLLFSPWSAHALQVHDDRVLKRALEAGVVVDFCFSEGTQAFGGGEVVRERSFSQGC